MAQGVPPLDGLDHSLFLNGLLLNEGLLLNGRTLLIDGLDNNLLLDGFLDGHLDAIQLLYWHRQLWSGGWIGRRSDNWLYHRMESMQALLVVMAKNGWHLCDLVTDQSGGGQIHVLCMGFGDARLDLVVVLNRCPPFVPERVVWVFMWLFLLQNRQFSLMAFLPLCCHCVGRVFGSVVCRSPP